MGSPSRSSILHAGAQIATPRGNVGASNAASKRNDAGAGVGANDPKMPYRKQKEWQELVDQITTESVGIRDSLLKEVSQMKHQLAQLRGEHFDAENMAALKQSSLEWRLEGKSREVDSLQSELQRAVSEEISAKRALDMTEANCRANNKQLEVTIACLQQAAVADAEGFAAKEQVMNSRLEAARACESEARQAASAGHLAASEACRASDAAIQRIRLEEIEVSEAASLSEAANFSERQQLQAALDRSQQVSSKAESNALLQQQRFQVNLERVEAGEAEARAAEARTEQQAALLRQGQREEKMILERQQQESRRVAELAEKRFESRYQALETKVMQAQEHEEEQARAQEAKLKSEVKRLEEAATVRCQVLETEAARAANAASESFSAQCRALEAQAKTAVAEIKQQHVQHEEQLDARSLQAERDIASVETASLARLQRVEEAMHMSEEQIMNNERLARAQEEVYKEQLQAKQEHTAQANQRVSRVEKDAAEQCQEMEAQVASVQTECIEVKHELARAHVAAQAQSRRLEVSLDRAHEVEERAECDVRARYRHLEQHVHVVREQEASARRSAEQAEAVLNERCRALDSASHRWHNLEIEAYRAEATTAAAAMAEQRCLETVAEQLRWNSGREIAAHETRAEELQSELEAARAERAAAHDSLVKLEAHSRGLAADSRSRRPGRKPDGDGVTQYLERMAKARAAAGDLSHQPKPGRGEDRKDSPDAGGGAGAST